MRRAKISIIGAGNVGATCAHWAAAKELGDIVLLEIPEREGVAKGKALDLACCAPIERFDSPHHRHQRLRDIAGSDVVVVTAGVPRKPGQSRDDLIQINVGIVKSVCEKIREFAPESIVIVVSNPLDAMVYTAWKVTGFPTHRVMGQAGALDVARYKTFLAMELGVSVEDISGPAPGRARRRHGAPPAPHQRQRHPAHRPAPRREDQRPASSAPRSAAARSSSSWAPAPTTPPPAAPSRWSSHRPRQEAHHPLRRLLRGRVRRRPRPEGQGLLRRRARVLGTKGVEKIVTFNMTPDEKKLMHESVSHVKDLVGRSASSSPILGDRPRVSTPILSRVPRPRGSNGEQAEDRIAAAMPPRRY
jgi:malate dehydrogenase